VRFGVIYAEQGACVRRRTNIYWQLDGMIADIWRVPQNPETVERPSRERMQLRIKKGPAHGRAR
jgi:hypothetical protein